MVSCALSDGKPRSFEGAVTRVGSLYPHRDGRVIGGGTGAYAAARRHFNGDVLRAINVRFADTAESAFEASGPRPAEGIGEARVFGRIFMIDGFTVTMSDTVANQEVFPQNPRQKQGLGSPIARCVVMISMSTGLMHDLAMGRYAGKQAGETALLRELLHRLRPGDLAVADSYHCTYLPGARGAATRGGTVDEEPPHAKQPPRQRPAHWVRTSGWWPGRIRPAPRGCRLRSTRVTPKSLPMRYVDATKSEPRPRRGLHGGRPRRWTRKRRPPRGSRRLYRGRWWVELDIRTIKSDMKFDHLRAQTPATANVERWMALLA